MLDLEAKHVWQTAIEQLRVQNHAVNPWLSEVQLIDWKDNCYTAAVRSDRAREWLESRVSSTLSRILSALMDTRQTVEFVSEQPEVEAISDETLHQFPERPDRVITLPGYYRRWLPVLGADLAWMYIAFRQAAYLAGQKQGQSQVHLSGKQISALCGITERTFWNRLEAKTWERLSGLVERIQINGRTAKNRYRLWMSLPLTPQDAQRLARWLEGLLAEAPAQLLERAKRLTFEELESLSVEGDGAARSVRQVVQEVVKGVLRFDESEALIATLQERLMPSSDILVMRHFFLEHVLPRLGVGPAWLYILLRDRCWEGEIARDVVLVEGGYAELARWLGLSRPLTVYEWLNSKPALLWAYVKPLEQERVKSSAGKWGIPRSFKVLLSDMPLEYMNLKDDEAVGAYFAQGRFTLGVREFGREFHSLRTLFTEFGDAIFTSKLRDFQTPVTRFSYFSYANFRPRLRDFQTLVTRFSDHLSSLSSGLSSLSSGLNSESMNHDPVNFNILINTNQLAQNNFSTKSTCANKIVNRSVGIQIDWKVLEELGLNPETQKRMIAAGLAPWMYISWLLYALEQNNIHSPLGFAASQALKTRQGAGGEHDALAKSPVRLAARLADDDPVGLKRILLGGES